MRTGKKESFAARSPIAPIAWSKVIARSTFHYHTTEGHDVIRYHRTDIIVKKDGRTVLHSGGWRTLTTKERLNEYLPREYGVFSYKGEWWVQYEDQDWPMPGYVKFYDGMVLPDAFKKED